MPENNTLYKVCGSIKMECGIKNFIITNTYGFEILRIITFLMRGVQESLAQQKTLTKRIKYEKALY